jgi:hypothetical protein
MIQKAYQLTLNFDKILDLVTQLTRNDKIWLSRRSSQAELRNVTQLCEMIT